VNYPNTQVTFDASPANARSESSLAANPGNPANLVGASKKFINPNTYDFTLAAYASLDAGASWTEAPALALLPSWGGISDPVVVWDGAGNVYLVALPFGPNDGPTLGIAIYRSSDGGLTWSGPNVIHSSMQDDKQWAATDASFGSPHFGNVYAVWDDGSDLRFARTTDSGGSWHGIAGQGAGSMIAGASFAPQISVAPDGDIYVVWTSSYEIRFVKSVDGGDSFSTPAVAAAGITPLTSPPLNAPDNFPELPGGTFRVLTLATCVAGDAGTVLAAWADYRENVARIYYVYSHDGGASWQPANGQRMISGSGSSPPDQHEFHPHLRRRPDGALACAFYRFGPYAAAGGARLIDVELTESHNNGAGFEPPLSVTARPWDPTVDAPWSHGRPTTTFIGEYFGFDGTSDGWSVLWTDTRTGVQEMFYGTELHLGPWTGVQFADTLDANTTIDYFSYGWPVNWFVAWMVVPTTPDGGNPQLTWFVQVEKYSPYFLTYHVHVTNLTNRPIGIEGRFGIFAK
jgi:hypothetical protein